MRRFDLLCLACFVAVGAGLPRVAAAQAADEPPRFRFRPGDHLVYDCVERSAGTSPDSPGATRSWELHLWCLSADDTEYQLLLERVEPDGGRDAAAMRLSDLGRCTWPPEMTPFLERFEPALVLVPMLPLPVQDAAQWTSAPDILGRRWHCTSAPVPDARQQRRIAFELRPPRGFDEVQPAAMGGHLAFDAGIGCAVYGETTIGGREAAGPPRFEARLTRRLSHPRDWAARRAVEAERFLRTARHEERVRRQVLVDPASIATAAAQLDRLWAGFESEVDLRAGSPFAAIARARRRAVPSLVRNLRPHSELAERWLNKPASTWSLQDAAGNTRTSEQARRGVTVEYFWSSESIGALRGLAAVRAVGEQLRDADVGLLCYNMDANVVQSVRAVMACGYGLDHMLGGPLRDVERLPELPVLRVLDAAGVVRGLWVGWQPDYAGCAALARELADAPRR